MIGRFDLVVCGNSDPGTSGILSPFADMNGSYFDPKDEPDDFIFEFMDECNKVLEEQGAEVLKIQFNSHDDYYRVMNEAREFSKNNFRVYGVSYDSPEIIIQKEEKIIAEHEVERNDE